MHIWPPKVYHYGLIKNWFDFFLKLNNRDSQLLQKLRKISYPTILSAIKRLLLFPQKRKGLLLITFPFCLLGGAQSIITELVGQADFMQCALKWAQKSLRGFNGPTNTVLGPPFY